MDLLIDTIIQAQEAALEAGRVRGMSRELSLVMTKLDEAAMWENARREKTIGAGGESEPLGPPLDPTQA